MAASSKIKVILVEGDTEVSLFQKMKRGGVIGFKSIVKKNLWQDSIKSYAITIPRGCDLLVVFDTDELGQVERFISNVRFLNSRGHNVYLLQQKNNFEEELAWCCGKSVEKLIANFCVKKTSGVNDFKRDFIACKNPIPKLIKLGMQDVRWFARDLHESLHPLVKMKSSFKKHFSLD